MVNEVCNNGNVGIIARSRYDRQAIYQSGQPVSQGFELPAEFLPDDPVYHVNIFGGGFQIQIFVNRPAHFFGKVRPILGGQFIERPNCIFRQMERLALCFYGRFLQINPPFQQKRHRFIRRSDKMLFTF